MNILSEHSDHIGLPKIRMIVNLSKEKYDSFEEQWNYCLELLPLLYEY